jgi:hypothetical protein
MELFTRLLEQRFKLFPDVLAAIVCGEQNRNLVVVPFH